MELSEQELVWARKTLEETGLFVSCSAAEMDEILSSLEKKHFAASATIIFQGEISSKLCLIVSGEVSVFMKKFNERVKIAGLGPNTYFGEISLLRPRAAIATVKSETETEIIYLPGELIQKLTQSNPDLAEKINKEIEKRLESQKIFFEE